jgi:hypothetical protein
MSTPVNDSESSDSRPVAYYEDQNPQELDDGGLEIFGSETTPDTVEAKKPKDEGVESIVSGGNDYEGH